MIALRVTAWFCVGLAMALALRYMLYRMTLPIKPFMYQVF